jgi:hypothetical protein
VGVSTLDEMPQPSRVGLPRERTVAANNAVAKVTRKSEPRENCLGRPEWLIGQHRQHHARTERIEHLGNAGIWSCERQQTAVVNREEALEGVWRRLDTGFGERARHQHRRAVAHHPADRLLGMRRRAALAQQLIGRFSEIAP